jgi:hypothetical protein
MGAPHEVALPPVAARYFPPSSGKYEVKPGLVPLGTDFGNGEADKLTFQFDAGFANTAGQAGCARRAPRELLPDPRFRSRDAGLVCRFIAHRPAEGTRAVALSGAERRRCAAR